MKKFDKFLPKNLKSKAIVSIALLKSGQINKIKALSYNVRFESRIRCMETESYN